MRSQCVPGSQKNREPGYEAKQGLEKLMGHMINRQSHAFSCNYSQKHVITYTNWADSEANQCSMSIQITVSTL